MARSIADLISEMRSLGLTVTPEMTRGRGDKKLIMEALARAKNVGVDLLPQIEVMLCRDAKEWVDINTQDPFDTYEMRTRFWDNPNWIAEQKLDGNRLKCHITTQGIRWDSRRRSDETYTFSEKTGNFPHLEVCRDQELFDTILDGEIICPKAIIDTGSVITRSTQQATSAIVNSGKEKSIEIQEKNQAWANYYMFDIIKYRGEYVSGYTFNTRRVLLKKVHLRLSGLSDNWKKSSLEPVHKLQFFKDIVASGGEGVVLKHVQGKYEFDKRSKYQYKLKKYSTQDGFIVGWIPGESGNEGLVGAVEVACIINGKQHAFASVSQFTQSERIQMTASDGSLKNEYYGRVVEVRGQQLTKMGRFQHAVFLGWRKDKGMKDCDGYELEKELIELGVI